MNVVPKTPINVFLSHAPEDEPLAHEFQIVLAVLRRLGAVRTRSPADVAPGQPMYETSSALIAAADVVVLLVSPRFFNSDACWSHMTEALKQRDRGKAHVIPILLAACAWQDTPLAQLGIVPRTGESVTASQNRDHVWDQVLSDLKRYFTLISSATASNSVRLGRDSTVAMEANDPYLSACLGDRFEVRNVIRRNASGAIYVATDMEDAARTRVALRLIINTPDSAHEIDRLARESNTCAKLTHYNTLRCIRSGFTAMGDAYMVTELPRGETLEYTLATRAGVALPLPRVVRIVRQICDSLSEAHQVGVLHRDLCPANIFLTIEDAAEDVVKVTGYGALDDSTRNRSPRSRARHPDGNPAYMSPERLERRAMTPRSDIYSLAVITYKMLTGRLPFYAGTLSEWACAHVASAPLPFEDSFVGTALPKCVKLAVYRALSKDLRERPASPTQFYAELIGTSPTSPPGNNESQLTGTNNPGDGPVTSSDRLTTSLNLRAPITDLVGQRLVSMLPTNPLASDQVRGGIRLAVEAEHELDTYTAAMKRRLAASEYIDAIECILLTRYGRLVRNDRGGIARLAQSDPSDTSLPLLEHVYNRIDPSLWTIARWMFGPSRLQPPSLANTIQSALGIPDGLEYDMMALFGVRDDVLEKQKLTISDVTLMWLEWLSLCILHRTARTRPSDLGVPPT